MGQHVQICVIASSNDFCCSITTPLVTKRKCFPCSPCLWSMSQIPPFRPAHALLRRVNMFLISRAKLLVLVLLLIPLVSLFS